MDVDSVPGNAGLEHHRAQPYPHHQAYAVAAPRRRHGHIMEHQIANRVQLTPLAQIVQMIFIAMVVDIVMVFVGMVPATVHLVKLLLNAKLARRPSHRIIIGLLADVLIRHRGHLPS